MRGVFDAGDAGDAHEAKRLLNVALMEWQMSHPKLATWAEVNLPNRFAVFNSPVAHLVQMRTTNGLERLNMELKRRTRVATLLPNPATCLRLVNVLLGEQDEEWVTAKIHLNIKPRFDAIRRSCPSSRCVTTKVMVYRVT